ncbi:BON domain-containing protein [Actinokineospora sp. PR83]|uniref:BON domain-containing protein n=1 Tax=Actinokineospora sp. PR83 TaxID=2884908 RepID=UPI001F3900D5|nr:BON domain-containing protein [Actinokineospora sp. PR83]MCG8915554.1 BON domain-containing protein [Actinokineospora sp. PR83]
MSTTFPVAHPRAVGRPDEDIKSELDHQVLPAVPGVDTSLVHTLVEDGTVWLVGRLDWCGQAEVVRDRVAEVPGVVTVRDRLRCVWDDHPVYRWHPHLPRFGAHRANAGRNR